MTLKQKGSKQSKGVMIAPQKPPSAGNCLVPALYPPAVHWYDRHQWDQGHGWSLHCTLPEEEAAAGICSGNPDLGI